MPIRRGAGEVRQLLREKVFDLRTLDLGGFHHWLQEHLARWQQDPAFVQRCRIRDLRRSHPRLEELEEAYRQARARRNTDPLTPRIQETERELGNVQKAIAGLSATLLTADPAAPAALSRKRTEFQLRRSRLEQTLQDLIQASPIWRETQEAEEALEQYRAAIGLPAEETRLREMLRHRGRHSTQRGDRFEVIARQRIQEELLPAFPAGSQVLSGVTLGAAGVEFDLLIVHQPHPERVVEVLAVLEVKRNINDLGHGFRQRQRDLAWLVGDEPPEERPTFRTAAFPGGRFDRPAQHLERGNEYWFGPTSFQRFQRDPRTGQFLAGFYLFSRPGPIWGISSAALNRIAARIATDPRCDLNDPRSLARLQQWCRTLTHWPETPDVLQVYAADDRLGGQILLSDS